MAQHSIQLRQLLIGTRQLAQTHTGPLRLTLVGRLGRARCAECQPPVQVATPENHCLFSALSAAPCHRRDEQLRVPFITVSRVLLAVNTATQSRRQLDAAARVSRSMLPALQSVGLALRVLQESSRRQVPVTSVSGRHSSTAGGSSNGHRSSALAGATSKLFRRVRRRLQRDRQLVRHATYPDMLDADTVPRKPSPQQLVFAFFCTGQVHFQVY